MMQLDQQGPMKQPELVVDNGGESRLRDVLLVTLALLEVVLFGAFKLSGEGSIFYLLSLLCLLPTGCAVVLAKSAESFSAAKGVDLFGKYFFGWFVGPLAGVAFSAAFSFVDGALQQLLGTRNKVLSGVVFVLGMVLAEESIKYHASCRRLAFPLVQRAPPTTPGKDARRDVLCALFTALGLGTAKCIAISLILIDTENMASVNRSDNVDVICASLRTSAIVQIPMHVLAGYHIGLQVARRELSSNRLRRGVPASYPCIAAGPVTVRTTYYCLLWALAWAPFHLMYASTVFVPLFYLWIVYRMELKMPHSYLVNAGYTPIGEDDTHPAAVKVPLPKEQ